MATVEVRDVYKSFGPVEVIHGVSVTIEDGEFVVLLGPSGCGKTTLLRMIAGLEQITGGEIAIEGRVVNDVPPKERDIAMVFQNYALYPHMTVFQNMAFSLTLRHAEKSAINERVMRIAKILELSDYMKRYPRQLSGGQRQRVAMGRAIVRDPQVFLFDEPLSNLDAQLRVQMRTEIKALHQQLKTTSVYVTHDQVETMTMADRLVVLSDGIVEQVGEPLEIYDRPKNMFVAGFIGSPAMNFLEGTVQRHNGGMGVTLADGTVLPVPNDAAVTEGADVTPPVVPQATKRIQRTKFLAGRPEALQQISQRLFDVFFEAGQAFLSLRDPTKREQNQQWFMRRTLPVCPPESHLTEFLKKFAPFHGVGDVAYLLLDKVRVLQCSDR